MKTEARIQAECFTWFNNTYPQYRGLMYHVPNGEKRDAITANKLKAMGVVAGIPDLVFHFRSRTYFFEFKKSSKESISDAQEKVHKALDQQLFMIWVLWDLDTFKYLIENILTDTSEQFTFGLTRERYFYKHKVFSYLYNLEHGNVINISDVCEDKNKTTFMNIITEFINEGYDKLDNFEILFTPDYKAFYKKEKGNDKEIMYNNKTTV